MAQHSSLHVGGATYNNLTSSQDARLAEAGLLALNGPGPLDVRPGILHAPGNPGLVTGTSSTSPWEYSVNAGTFVTTKGPTDGPHVSTNDGTYLATTTPPPGANSRYDLIYVQQLDADATISPDASSSCVIAVLQGPVSATPSIPATPAGATVLATALVLSSATAGTSGPGVTIDTTVSRFTTVRGAPIPVRNATERAELTAYDELQVKRLDLGIIETNYGGTWRSAAPFTMVTGSFPVTTTSGTPNIATTVTLPAGVFTQPPNVQCMWSSPSGFPPGMRTFTVTAASFGVNVLSGAADQGPVSGTVYWVAVQATQTTA